MSVIDFHTHVFPDDLAPRAIESMRRQSPGMVNYADGTRADLIASMRNAGISRAATLPVATRPGHVRSINRFAVALNAAPLISFGTLFPGAEGVDEEINFLRNGGIRGVKLHPEYQGFHVDDRAHYPMYEALRAAAMIVVFHAGWDPGPFSCERARPQALRRVVDDLPGLTIVAAHLGGMKMWDAVEEHLVGAKVYFDTSAVMEYMSREQFMRIVRTHGAERIVFGTDSPWFDQGETFRWIDAMPLCDREKEWIFGENARRLLGEEECSRLGAASP